MSNLSINQASKLFKTSRNTIYSRIKSGQMTKGSDGMVSVQDMVRLFGNKSDKKAIEKAVIELLDSNDKTLNNIEQPTEQIQSNNEQLLLLKIEQLTNQVEQLEKQLDYVKTNESWLRSQLDQKLIENKTSTRKSLLGRFFN